MIEDAIRWIFWAFAKLFLSAADWIYEILNTIIGIDLSGNVVKYTWLFMLCFTSFACSIRIAYILLKQSSDDDKPNIDYGKLCKRIVGVFTTIALSYTFFVFVLGVPKAVVDIYNDVMIYDERLVPSSAVISATSKTAISTVLGDMTSTDEVISIETIDSQLNTKEDDRYIYFFGYAEMFLCIIGAIAVLCMQLNIVVDVTMRLFLNVFRFVIGFIPISSLIEDNSTCGDWIKDIISDSLVMAFSLVFTQMVFGLMSTEAITSLNGIVRIVVFTLALMAVSKSSEFIAKYFNASNLSSGGRVGNAVMAMGAFAAVKGAGHILKGIASGAGKGIGKMGEVLSPNKESKSANVNNDVSASAPISGGDVAFGGSINNSYNNSSASHSQNGNGFFVDSNRTNGSNYNNSPNSAHQSDNNILDRTPTSSNNNVNLANSTRNTNNRTVERKADNNTENKSNSLQQHNSHNSRNNQKGNNNANSNSIKYNNSTKTFGGINKTAFVDDDTTGHLYKRSNYVYRSNPKDRYTYNNSTSTDQTVDDNNIQGVIRSEDN